MKAHWTVQSRAMKWLSGRSGPQLVVMFHRPQEQALQSIREACQQTGVPTWKGVQYAAPVGPNLPHLLLLSWDTSPDEDARDALVRAIEATP